MTPVTIHLPSSTSLSLNSGPTHSSTNPLPPLLHTPLGLALLELQGTINFPDPEPGSSETRFGKLVFPDYRPADPEQQQQHQEIATIDSAAAAKQLKKVWLYVGHQRLQGEVKKLTKPLGVLRKRTQATSADAGHDSDGDEKMQESGAMRKPGHEVEEIEMIEVIEWKLVFSSRPEPVGIHE